MREPGASPGRSRRCEGRSSRSEKATGREAGKADQGGRPESEDLSFVDSNPSRKEDSYCIDARSCSSRPWSCAAALVPAALAVNVHVRVEGKSRTLFGATEPTVDVPANALDALKTTAMLAEFYYHVTLDLLRALRRPDRPLPGGRERRLGLQGGRRVVAGRRRPDAAEGRRHAALVLGRLRPDDVRRPEDARSSRRRRRTATPPSSQDDKGAATPAAGATLHVGSKRTVATSGGAACVGTHTGLLVRATLAGRRPLERARVIRSRLAARRSLRRARRRRLRRRRGAQRTRRSGSRATAAPSSLKAERSAPDADRGAGARGRREGEDGLLRRVRPGDRRPRGRPATATGSST